MSEYRVNLSPEARRPPLLGPKSKFRRDDNAGADAPFAHLLNPLRHGTRRIPNEIRNNAGVQ